MNYLLIGLPSGEGFVLIEPLDINQIQYNLRIGGFINFGNQRVVSVPVCFKSLGMHIVHSEDIESPLRQWLLFAFCYIFI